MQAGGAQGSGVRQFTTADFVRYDDFTIFADCAALPAAASNMECDSTPASAIGPDRRNPGGGRSLGLENLVHIPNGVDTGRFCPVNQEQKGVLRERLGLLTGGKLVLFSGRLVMRKRADVLLAALPSVLNKHPDCCVLIAGSGQLQQDDVEGQLREMVRKLDINHHVRFLGQVNGIEDYLNAADVFVFPSEHEGMPNAVLEAMATGLPIVASRIGGVTDLVDDEIAWLVPPGDSDALGETLCTVLDDPDEAVRRGRLVRERAEHDFSLSAIASRYEQLYLRLIL
jgi:glycosyltransferase involved in cell wall biosynthesis